MSSRIELFKETHFLSDSSSEEFNEIDEVRKAFNYAFQMEDIDIQIDNNFTISRTLLKNMPSFKTEASNIRDLFPDLLLNNFFFFPSHKLYLFDGVKRQELGYRVWFVRRIKGGYKCKAYDLVSKNLQNIFRLSTEQFFGKKFTFMERFQEMYPSYMRIFKKVAVKLNKNSFIVYTTQSGWVQGRSNWFYVPVSPVNENDLLYSQALDDKYKMLSSKPRAFEESFQHTWNMLKITNKSITLPLLSYTFLSLITSLMDYNESHLPKFMLCLSGNNEAMKKQSLANLFCNLYGRKSNISSLNSIYHLRAEMDKKSLEKKAAKIRDGIFIIDVDTRPKMIDRILYSLKTDDLENMLLVLSEKQLDREFVLNLNISDLDVESELIKNMREYPDLLSDCVFYTIENFRRELEYNGLYNKQNIGTFFSKKHEYFRNLIEANDYPLEVDKVHMYACLLVGLDLLLEAVKQGIDDQSKSDEIHGYMEEAIELFRQECAVAKGVSESKSRDILVDEAFDEKTKEEHVVFLEKLFEMLPTPLPRFENKDDPNIFVWTDEHSEEILSIETVIFHRILSLVDSTFESLNPKEQKSAITKYKLRIYKKLRSKELSIILPKSSEVEDKVVNIGTTEKADYTGNRNAKTRRDFNVFRMHKGIALTYLDTINN